MARRLILVGAGHAHAVVLKAWASAPPAGVDLVVVSPHALAPYSGMVPGWLSGAYRFDDIVIDFERLCVQAGARWIRAELESLDPARQTLTLSSQERLSYDWLSLNVGSTVVTPGGTSRARMMPMRPLAELRQRYESLLSCWHADRSEQPLKVVAVGGGAAGVESLLAVLHRLRRERADRAVQGSLITRSADILPGYPVAARRAALRALREAGAEVRTGTAWSDSVGDHNDWVLWATGAQAQAWQRDLARRGALAVSAEGYIRIDAQLRSVSHPTVFAVGDCAQWTPPLPKAGVYAVRMGPVLTHNLSALLDARPLRSYTPQSRFLSLLATADGQAIASRGHWSLSGRWAWRLKDSIDRSFIRQFASTHPL